MSDRDWWVQAPLDVRGTRWLVIAALTAVVAILLRQPLLLILAVVLGLVAAGARLWWRYGLSNVTYRRHFSTKQAAYDDEVEMEVVIENAKPLPLVWLHVLDEFPSHLDFPGLQLGTSSKPGVGVFQTFFSVRPYERVRQRYRIRCRRRGLHRFGPVTLTTGDPFGFSARESERDVVDALIVYPRVVPLTLLGLPAQHPLGNLTPRHRQNEDPMRIAGVRPYVAGDDLRRIHWRATARTGELQTRVLDPSAAPVVALFLDANTFEHFWEGQNTWLQELAITVAASLAAHLLGAKIPTGLYVNAPTYHGKQDIRIAPGRHPGQLQRILKELALMIPATGARLERTLLAETPSLPWGTTVVIVTANVTEGLQQALARLTRHGQRYVLVSCGPEPDLHPDLRQRLLVRHVGQREAWDEIDHISLAI